MKNTRLQDLLLRYYHQDISAPEKAELIALMNEKENKEAVNDILDGLFLNAEAEHTLKTESADEILSSIFLTESAGHFSEDGERPAVRTNWWVKSLVAASTGLLMIFAGYQIYLRNDSNKPDSFIAEKPVRDIAPGGLKAQLTLSSGKVVNLAAVADGFLTSEQLIEVNKGRGEVKFSQSTRSRVTQLSSLNILTTPKGGQYKLTLPDGSKAWLNAESSLRFPDSFEKKRVVEMHGEVYFEIFPDKTKPFIVKIPEKKVKGKEMEIVVLGTHFNISSYNDEPKIQTTLLEGSVKITSGDVTRLLSPGQQAEVEARGADKSIKIKTVDTDRVVAWKEGRFDFNGSVKDIMRQISRWYDLDVAYQDDIGDKTFIGAISRKKNVSEVLKMLEMTGDIRFELEDKKLVVKKVKQGPSVFSKE